MWAVAQGHAAVAQVLIEHGADVHARSAVWDQLENTAGNTNPIGNFRMPHGGSTPLLFAARQGDIETARVLVEAGADPNDTNAAGTSALVVAAHSGHGPLGIFLLEQGADPNATDAGYAALHAAVLRSQVELVDALLAHGADVNAILEHGTPGRRFSADYSLRYQLIGANAFWLAARYGEVDILRLVASQGANPLAMPESGRSSLQAAMGITRGTETRRNRVGIPPTDTTAQERLTAELARIALDLGVDVNAVDTRGDTALHYAVRRGFESVIELLAEAGADLNIANDRDETPLSLADSAQSIPGSYERGTHPTIATLLRRLGAR
jgi:ankyrin repeat protein